MPFQIRVAKQILFHYLKTVGDYTKILKVPPTGTDWIVTRSGIVVAAYYDQIRRLPKKVSVMAALISHHSVSMGLSYGVWRGVCIIATAPFGPATYSLISL